MKFNEYELIKVNEKLKLKAKKHFDEIIEYIDDSLHFVLSQYDLKNSAIEKAFVLSYDNDGNLNGVMQVGQGDHKNVDFNLNTCFKFLLLNNAFGCVFVHNHMKILDPSAEDYMLHGTIMSICSTLNINMFANVILCGDKEYYDILKGERCELIYER